MKNTIKCLLSLIVMSLFVSCANREKGEKLQDKQDSEGYTKTEIAENEIPQTDEDSPERFIYQIFFSPSMYEGNDPYNFYNAKMKDKFKEMNISTEYGESPYSKTFEKYLNELENLEKRTDDIIGFDWDILWESQDTQVDFGFETINVETFPAAFVETKWTNGVSKSYFLVKENGKWKILDMITKETLPDGKLHETDYLMETKQIIKENK